MNKLSCCRVCLADNIKMHILVNTPLQELYENLTSTKLESQGKSTKVCYLCHALLQQCLKFQDAAKKSDAILTQLYQDQVTSLTDIKLASLQPSLHSYIHTAVEHIDLNDDSERDRYTWSAKQEEDAEYNEDSECFERDSVKVENSQDDGNDITDTEITEQDQPLGIKYKSSHSEISSTPIQTNIHNLKTYEPSQRSQYLEIDGRNRTYFQDSGLKFDPKHTVSVNICDGSAKNLDYESRTSNSQNLGLDHETRKYNRHNIDHESRSYKSHNLDHESRSYKSHNLGLDHEFRKYNIHNLDLDHESRKYNNHDLTFEQESSKSNSHNLDFDQGSRPSNSHNLDFDQGSRPSNSHNLDFDQGSRPSNSHNLDFDQGSRPSNSHNLDFDQGSRPSNSHNLDLNESRCIDNQAIKLYGSRKINSQALRIVKELNPPNIQDLELKSVSRKSNTQNLDLGYESRHPDTQSSAYQTDSEDDLPLKMLRRRTVKKKKLNKKEETKKREYKAWSCDASVSLIPRADQLAAMRARASSHNYLHSTYKCALCYRGFLTEEVYNKHMEKHDEARGAHACPVCALRYSSARQLAAHAHAAHERRYSCNVCQHVSLTKNQASDHQRIHNGDLFQCKICSKSYHARTTYLSHMRVRHPAPYKGTVCAGCGESFVSEQGLAMHRAKMHAHHGGGESSLSSARDFVCTSCGERFNDEQDLQLHRGTKHTGVLEEDTCAGRLDSRYCATCDIHFASRRAWTRHVLSTPAHIQLAVHTKECPICLQTIQGTVRSHMLIHDRETKPRTTKPTPPTAPQLNCDQCSQSFATKSRLNAHVRRIHLGLKYNKNLVCETCGKQCTSGATLRYHQRTHTGERPYACSVSACGKRFPDRNQLRIHTRTHTGERPYTCERCGKRFAQKPALNRHNRVHLGIKPHTCDICGKSFSQSNSLNTHIKSVHLKMPQNRKFNSKSAIRKPPQNAVEARKNGDLNGAVNVNNQLTSNVTMIDSGKTSEVTLVDSQVTSKINLGH